MRKLLISVLVGLCPFLVMAAHSPCESVCKGTCVAAISDCTLPGRLYTGEFCNCFGSPDGAFCCVPDVCDMEPVCEDTCMDSPNNICEDGGQGSENNNCEYKADCADCGPRQDKCETEFHGVCRTGGVCRDDETPRDEPDLCTQGTGCICCKPKCQERDLTSITCEDKCQGHCVQDAADCSFAENAFTGALCSCDGAPAGHGVCCTSVCRTEAVEKCETSHRGLCREQTTGCLVNEIPVFKEGLCLQADCLCCKPHCDNPSPPCTGDCQDPKFTTLDGRTFHFEGKCTYTLLRECEDPFRHPWFVVYVEHTSERVLDSLGHSKTYVKGAIVEVDNKNGGKHTIHLMNHGHVKINDGPEIDLDAFNGWEDKTIGLHVQRYNQMVNITLDGYFMVSSSRKENVFVKLGERLQGKICGLMGNADGNPDNDIQMIDPFTPSGLKVLQDPTMAEINMFGDSWLKPGSCPEFD